MGFCFLNPSGCWLNEYFLEETVQSTRYTQTLFNPAGLFLLTKTTAAEFRVKLISARSIKGLNSNTHIYC